MSNETNEILTIAGERVEVRYESDFYEACDKCCFHNIFVRCNVRTLRHGCPCEKYRDDKNRRFAYFVRTEEDENKPQKALPEVIYCGRNCYGNLSYSNTKVLPNMRPYVPAEEIEGTPKEVTLIPSNEDEDEAAEMAARRAYPYEGGTKGDICEASIPIFCKGFKAGIAWERERLMKEAVGCMFSFTEDKTPCLLIGDGYALRVNAKKGDYFEAIIIKKEK